MTVARRLPLLALVVAAGCTNLAVVDSGLLYRSAQLDEEELEEVIDAYGIRTIINLRGHRLGQEWWQVETEVAQRRGVEMISINMKAHRLPHREDLITLLDAFRNAARPILIHCKAGADRTGEASAIYGLEYMGLSEEEALGMLSLRYLHTQLFTPAKSYFIREVYQGEAWAREHYDPCEQEYEYYDQEEHCPRP